VPTPLRARQIQPLDQLRTEAPRRANTDSARLGVDVTCSVCQSAEVVTKGKCKRCYHREYSSTPERKEARRRYLAANRDRIRAHEREYNQNRRPPRNKNKPVSDYGVVRVSVKGWGFACRA
jgi:hypothetical protein